MIATDMEASTDKAARAIEAWQRNRLTTYTASNILSDFGDVIIAALRATPPAAEVEAQKALRYHYGDPGRYVSPPPSGSAVAMREALEQIAARVAKKAPRGWRIICPVCGYKSVEPNTEARHAPNCAGEIARAALAATPHSRPHRGGPLSD